MASLAFIRKFIESQYKCPEYIPQGGTRCPVCEFCGIEHIKCVVIHTDSNGLRRLKCEGCTTSFKAIGKPKEVDEQQILPVKSEKTKKASVKSKKTTSKPKKSKYSKSGKRKK